MAKRKREEVDDDSEDERPTGQAQILPVATKLPESGEITNGMEYLLTVRYVVRCSSNTELIYMLQARRVPPTQYHKRPQSLCSTGTCPSPSRAH